MELFDLTLPLGPDLPVMPGDPALALEPSASHAVEGFEVTRICLGSHSGTHVEAPRHFYPQGPTLDRFPLERFMGRGVVFDCCGIAHTHGSDLERQALVEQLDRWPLAENGLALLLTDKRPLPLWAAQLLAEAGVGLVGTDAASIDEEPYPVHRFLLGRDILIAENLEGLERLGPGPIDCALLPIALAGTDAAPIRAIAWR